MLCCVGAVFAVCCGVLSCGVLCCVVCCYVVFCFVVLCRVVVFCRSCLGSIFGRFGDVLGRFLVVLGGLWEVLGRSWAPFGGLLGGLLGTQKTIHDENPLFSENELPASAGARLLKPVRARTGSELLRERMLSLGMKRELGTESEKTIRETK